MNARQLQSDKKIKLRIRVWAGLRSSRWEKSLPATVYVLECLGWNFMQFFSCQQTTLKLHKTTSNSCLISLAPLAYLAKACEVYLRTFLKGHNAI